MLHVRRVSSTGIPQVSADACTGFGVSVVNARCQSRLDLRVSRNGAEWFRRLSRWAAGTRRSRRWQMAHRLDGPARPVRPSATRTGINAFPEHRDVTNDDFPDFKTLEHGCCELEFLTRPSPPMVLT